ncbi:VOC family protein [Streptomyces sp. NPDC059092]|uniref:VOC family protein n=1 Tax=Streptomyces sp. NPDC059092 TaxID=3346725 RepID=UPI00367CBEB4
MCASLSASGFPRGGSTPSTARPPPHTGRGRTRVPRAPRNRVHLDLLTADPEAEIRRLTALGATAQAGHTDNVVLTDPEDNGFCLSATDRKAGTGHARSPSTAVSIAASAAL